jgi:DnaJ-class molecular chaperone
MADIPDPYIALGVSKGAADDVIRTAYRKLARKFHPDVNPNDKAAEERFKEVSSAYDVLSDPKKRALYDEFGSIGLREGFDAQRARAYARGGPGMGGGGRPGGFGGQAGQGGPEFDLGDLFGDLFAGGGGRRRGPQRGRDVVARVEISFRESLEGREISLQLGGGSSSKCQGCGGSGKIGGPRGNPCGVCQGSGQSPGGGTVTVRIPKGADNGSKLRVAGRGEPGPGGAAAGDLIIETQVRPHPHFSREGLNLLLRLPISLEEAYNGASVGVPTPSGEVSLKVPPLSHPNTRLRLRDRGVQRGSQTGDLLVELDVRFPERSDEAVAAALKQASSDAGLALRQNLQF